MAHHHLVQQHTKRPPVDSLRIALTLKQLGRNVLRRPAKGYEARFAGERPDYLLVKSFEELTVRLLRFRHV